MASIEYRLTTFDNPYDPFTEFENWFLFDSEQGYNSCGYLARVTETTPEMTDEEYDSEVERGIDSIIRNDFRNIYRKVKKGQVKKERLEKTS